MNGSRPHLASSSSSCRPPQVNANNRKPSLLVPTNQLFHARSTIVSTKKIDCSNHGAWLFLVKELIVLRDANDWQRIDGKPKERTGLCNCIGVADWGENADGGTWSTYNLSDSNVVIPSLYGPVWPMERAVHQLAPPRSKLLQLINIRIRNIALRPHQDVILFKFQIRGLNSMFRNICSNFHRSTSTFLYKLNQYFHENIDK